MAKTKKPKPVPVKKSTDPEHARQVRRVAMHVLAALVFMGICGWGLWGLRRHVEKDVVFPDRPPKVVLLNRPPWMSDFLAEQIVAAVRPMGTHSSFDHRVLVDINSMLRTNPWIKQVRQVRRAYDRKPGDTIEIDCDYRAPIALVHWRDYYWLVDGDGVKLPEQFTADQLPRIVMGANRKLNIRVISGVRQPPVESGERWPGDDLSAGLDLVKLLHGQPYAEEIVRVDVSNYGARESMKRAQLTLITRYDSEIRWGRPINSRDFFIEVSPSQKLAYLRDVYQQFHRVDGNHAWIDIRFDKITCPSGPETARLDDGR
jgi:cell division septal protein FtsQ